LSEIFFLNLVSTIFTSCRWKFISGGAELWKKC